MRRIQLVLSLFVCVFLFLLGGLAQAQGGGDRVEICKIPPGNPANFHTIAVSSNAVDAHLATGSFLGSCNLLCDNLCDDGDLCTQDWDPSAETCECFEAPRPAVICEDGIECTVDWCDASSGLCVATPDDDLCAVGEVCDPFEGCVSAVTCPCEEFYLISQLYSCLQDQYGYVSVTTFSSSLDFEVTAGYATFHPGWGSCGIEDGYGLFSGCDLGSPDGIWHDCSVEEREVCVALVNDFLSEFYPAQPLGD